MKKDLQQIQDDFIDEVLEQPNNLFQHQHFEQNYGKDDNSQQNKPQKFDDDFFMSKQMIQPLNSHIENSIITSQIPSICQKQQKNYIYKNNENSEIQLEQNSILVEANNNNDIKKNNRGFEENQEKENFLNQKQHTTFSRQLNVTKRIKKQKSLQNSDSIKTQEQYLSQENPMDTSVKNILKRTKEEIIADVVKYTTQWRVIPIKRKEEKLRKLNYKILAKMLKVKKKSLDDYWMQIKKGICHNYNFEDNFKKGIGHLRNYNACQKTNISELSNSIYSIKIKDKFSQLFEKEINENYNPSEELLKEIESIDLDKIIKDRKLEKNNQLNEKKKEKKKQQKQQQQLINNQQSQTTISILVQNTNNKNNYNQTFNDSQSSRSSEDEDIFFG